MSIHILFGPGGTGKSYYQMRLIIDELLRTKRNVCTNLSINMARLCAYLEEIAPATKCDVLNRLRILTIDETKEFWKHRGPYVYDPRANSINGFPTDGDPIIEHEGKLGTVFIIDEAGAAGFDAGGWAASEGRTTRGQSCAWYLDQQRKFSDDVYASQNGRRPAGIAKPFRDKAHFFIKLKNGYLQTYGIFKGRGRFNAFHYTHEPDTSSEPIKDETWHMDAKGVGSCYRTQDGVGVVGVNADIGKRAKGIPILFAIPIAIAFGCVVAVGIPLLLAKGVTGYTAAKSKEVTVAIAAVKKESSVDAIASSDAAPSKNALLVAGNVPLPVTVDGIVRKAGVALVMLSDGRTLDSATVDYLRIERTFVESPRGARFFFTRARTVSLAEKRTVEKESPATPVIHAATYQGEAIGPPQRDISKFDPVTMPSAQSGSTKGGRGMTGPVRPR